MAEHTPDLTQKIGFGCACGQRFVRQEQLTAHIKEEKAGVAVQAAAEEVEDDGSIEPETIEEEPIIEEEPMVEEKVEPKQEMTTIEEPKSITPVQQVQANVIKFTRQKLGEKRAAEFATQVALIARENTKIAQAIVANPDSFLTAYLASAKLDLMPNTPEQYAYIIPYGDKVQFQTGYRGLLQLARRSGEIKTINAELVFEGDDFDVQYGSERKITHKPAFDVNRTDYTKVKFAYATALLTNGEVQFAVMTRDELDKVQRTVKAQSTDTPWKQWPERMALKTVLKRLTQLLPTSTEDDLRKAVAYDNLSEGGKMRFDKNSGEIIEGEIVEVRQGAIDDIHAANTKEEIQEILQSLPVDERKKAAPLANKRIKELA